MAVHVSFFLLGVALVALPAAPVGASGLAALLESLGDGERLLVEEVLARSPEAAMAESRARAATQVAAQRSGLPNPKVLATAFLESPETRVGPQEWMLAASQDIPWRGKRQLEAESADHHALALGIEVDGVRLRLATELRALLLEHEFLDRSTAITEANRDLLVQHESIARSHYATGAGLGHEVVQLQAEITGIDNRLMALESSRSTLRAQINELRDRPPAAALPELAPAQASRVHLDSDQLFAQALESRPHLRAAKHHVLGAQLAVSRASMATHPDFVVGFRFTQVGKRSDPGGRLEPPVGNGDDILAIEAGLSIPLWRKPLDARIAEATEETRAAQDLERTLLAAARREIGDLAQQIDTRWRQYELLRDVLLLQAEEALDSATSGYIAGSLGALDLLSAEHTLFEAELAVARAETDYRIAIARLEGAIGAPIGHPFSLESAS